MKIINIIHLEIARKLFTCTKVIHVGFVFAQLIHHHKYHNFSSIMVLDSFDKNCGLTFWIQKMQKSSISVVKHSSDCWQSSKFSLTSKKSNSLWDKKIVNWDDFGKLWRKVNKQKFSALKGPLLRTGVQLVLKLRFPQRREMQVSPPRLLPSCVCLLPCVHHIVWDQKRHGKKINLGKKFQIFSLPLNFIVGVEISNRDLSS